VKGAEKRQWHEEGWRAQRKISGVLFGLNLKEYNDGDK
jgi:hypothetical protein